MRWVSRNGVVPPPGGDEGAEVMADEQELRDRNEVMRELRRLEGALAVLGMESAVRTVQDALAHLYDQDARIHAYEFGEAEQQLERLRLARKGVEEVQT